MMILSNFKKIQNHYNLNMWFSRIFNFFGIRKKILKGVNNKLVFQGAYLYKVKITIKGNNNEVLIGNLAKMKDCTIIINGSNHKLEIGDDCFLNNTKITFTQNEGKIKLGNKTTVNGALIYSGESQDIVVGEDCMFSSNVDIRTTDSHSIISLDSNQRINKASSISIGNHVWLGNGCKVWKGAEIGDHCIIGAGAVVTKKIKDNCIAAGTPAKEIKEGVTWDRKLLPS